MKRHLSEAVIGGAVGLLSYLSGLNWELLLIWFILMVADILSGVIKAKMLGKFASRDMKSGLYKKIGEFMLLLSLILVQRVIQIMGINIPVGAVFIGAFCFKEFSSIFENAIEMKIKIPPSVVKWFKVAQKTFEEKGE